MIKPIRTSKTAPFTYLEAVVVMLIIVVIVTVLLPGMNNMRTQSKRAACEYNLLTLGMALQAYAGDHDIYPTKPLISSLTDAKFISSSHEFSCPMDTSADADTYSMGYIGGHPRTIRYNDPLVVCGWHPRIGTLAVFSDTMVTTLQKRQNTGDVTATPLTVSYGGGEANPGFVLHDTEPLVIETDTGESTLVYGENGSYFISGSYDPLASGGLGEFTLFIGFDLAGTGKAKATASSSKHIRFHTSLLHCNLTVVSDPDKGETKITWKPPKPSDPTQRTVVRMKKTEEFYITHVNTGEYNESTTPESSTKYKPDVFLLNLVGDVDD